MLKRLTCLLLSLCLIMTLSACKNDDPSATDPITPPETQIEQIAEPETTLSGWVIQEMKISNDLNEHYLGTIEDWAEAFKGNKTINEAMTLQNTTTTQDVEIVSEDSFIVTNKVMMEFANEENTEKLNVTLLADAGKQVTHILFNFVSEDNVIKKYSDELCAICKSVTPTIGEYWMMAKDTDDTQMNGQDRILSPSDLSEIVSIGNVQYLFSRNISDDGSYITGSLQMKGNEIATIEKEDLLYNNIENKLSHMLPREFGTRDPLDKTGYCDTLFEALLPQHESEAQKLSISISEDDRTITTIQSNFGTIKNDDSHQSLTGVLTMIIADENGAPDINATLNIILKDEDGELSAEEKYNLFTKTLNLIIPSIDTTNFIYAEGQVVYEYNEIPYVIVGHPQYGMVKIIIDKNQSSMSLTLIDY